MASVTGTPRKVLDGVATGAASGDGGYQISDRGDLIYLRGAPSQFAVEEVE